MVRNPSVRDKLNDVLVQPLADHLAHYPRSVVPDGHCNLLTQVLTGENSERLYSQLEKIIPVAKTCTTVKTI